MKKHVARFLKIVAHRVILLILINNNNQKDRRGDQGIFFFFNFQIGDVPVMVMVGRTIDFIRVH